MERKEKLSYVYHRPACDSVTLCTTGIKTRNALEFTEFPRPVALPIFAAVYLHLFVFGGFFTAIYFQGLQNP